jgi:PAS domain S-box-containing protein
MAIVVERTPDVTSASGAVIEIVEDDQLVYRAASGIAREHLGMSLPFQGSLSGLAVREKSIMRCDDTENDPRVDGAACRKIGIRSMLIAPLLEGDTAVGALKTFSSRINNFSDLDLYALQLLAGMASGGLTQARTFRELEASEARYRLLFDRNVAGVFRSTLDGRMLDCNDALVQCLGYDSREDLLAHPAADFYDMPSAREDVLHMIQEKAMLNIRVALKRKDGTSVLGLVNASLVPAENGESHILGTMVEA